MPALGCLLAVTHHTQNASLHLLALLCPADTPKRQPRDRKERGHVTRLSNSSIASLSPAVLLKLLVLEDEREMLALPFSLSFINGLPGKQKAMEDIAQADPDATQAQRWSTDCGCNRRHVERRGASEQSGADFRAKMKRVGWNQTEFGA